MSRILLIDDDDAERKLASLHVSRAGYNVEECIDGLQALGRALAEPPDLILCDLHMPGLDGFGVLSALRAQPQTAAIPVIFLTSQAQHGNFRKAMRLGADDFLIKPVRREELLEAIASRLLRLELVKSAPLPVLRQESAPAGALDGPAGAPEEPAGAPELAQTLGDYRLESKIAKGGSSTIYLARAKTFGPQVALKVIHLDGKTPPDVLSRFINEHEMLERLRHPNIVQIYSQWFSDHHAYIAMEYFPGGDVRRLMNSDISVEVALAVLIQVAGALGAIHERGMVHRDMKPDNIMLRADGSLALADFGIATLKDTRLSITAHGEVFGTPAYIAPEQASAQHVDHRADLYALGVMFFELLTGKKPYRAANTQALLYQHVNLAIPELPAQFSHIQPLINVMMAKNPDNRIANAGMLIDMALEISEQSF